MIVPMLIRNLYFTYIVLFVIGFHCHSQAQTFKIHTVAFYNLENLFDTINAPAIFDEYSPIMALKRDRAKAYEHKIERMAYALSQIGKNDTSSTPGIIGVCEVENRAVLEDLVNTDILRPSNYGIIHYDSPDARGIDVALLYQKQRFMPMHSQPYTLRLYDSKTQKRVRTRDQLVVSGELEGDLIHIIVNHWPSRRGGEAASRHKRIAAAKLNKHIIDSLQQESPYAKIITMGDLNDNPTNQSVKRVLKTTNVRKDLTRKGLYNPFEYLYRKGLGTTAYRDTWSLFDQIIISKPLLENDRSSLRYYKAGIFNKHFLITATGTYKGYPFRSWNSNGFTNGYSDHFPVYIYLIKAI